MTQVQPTPAVPSVAEATAAASKGGPSDDLRKLLDKPLDKMKLEDFEALAKKDAGGSARVTMAMVKMNTAAFPETVFVKRDGALLRKVRCRVLLRNGTHLTSWPARKKRNDDDGDDQQQQPQAAPQKVFSINAAGFRYLNQFVGLQVITPPEVVVNSARQPNPFVEIDPKTSLPLRVYCRKLALGPSQATGALVATDVMIRLDLNIYLVETILSKLKWGNRGDDAWGQVGGEKDKPEVLPGVRANWRFLPVLSIGGVGVWINTSHPKMLSFLSEHMTRTKFIDRIVQTMTERNALKAHPSMPSSAPQVVNDIAQLEVVGWTRDWSQDELREIETLAMENRLHDIADEVISKEVTEQEIASEEGEAEMQGGLENESEAEQTSGLKKEEKPDDDVDVEALTAAAVEAISKHKRVHGPKPTKDKLKEIIEDRKPEEATLDELRKIIETFK